MLLPENVPKKRIANPNLQLLQGNMRASLAIEKLLLLCNIIHIYILAFESIDRQPKCSNALFEAGAHEVQRFSLILSGVLRDGGSSG